MPHYIVMLTMYCPPGSKYVIRQISRLCTRRIHLGIIPTGFLLPDTNVKKTALCVIEQTDFVVKKYR